MLGALAVVVIATMAVSGDRLTQVEIAVPPVGAFTLWLEARPLPLDLRHVVFFAVATSLARVLLPSWPWWRVLAVAMVAAAGTEFAQYLVPGRTPRLTDVRDNMIGAGVGLVLGALPLHASRWTQRQLHGVGWLVLAGIALLPLQQWPIAQVLGFPVLPSDALFLLAFAIRSLALAGGRAPLLLSGFHGWMAAYFLALLMAVFVVEPLRPLPGNGSGMCRAPAPDFMQGVAKWIGVCWLGVIATLACDMASRSAWRRSMAVAWLAGAALACAAAWLAIVGFYTGQANRGWMQGLLSHYGSLPPGPYPRVRSLFANANMFGLYLLLSVSIAFVARDAGWFSAPALRAFLLLAIVALLATVSPAIAAVVILCCVHAGTASSGGSGARAIGAAALLLSLASVALLLVDPAAPFQSPSVRARLWTEAWETWRIHPWRGSGLGQPSAEVLYAAPDGSEQLLTDAHNILLNLGAQAGMLGASAFLCLVGCLLWRGRPVLKLRAMWWGLLLAVGYLGIGGSFEDARVLWVFMGVMAGAMAQHAGAAAVKGSERHDFG